MTQITTMMWSLTEPDILEGEVKWVLGYITTKKKLADMMEYQLSYFKF